MWVSRPSRQIHKVRLKGGLLVSQAAHQSPARPTAQLVGAVALYCQLEIMFSHVSIVVAATAVMYHHCLQPVLASNIGTITFWGGTASS